MNYSQLEILTKRALIKMGAHSDSAVMAIMQIIAHESKRGEYIRQTNGGPALGLIQMEQPTYETTWVFGDKTAKYALRLNQSRNFKRLEWDLVHNIFMARCRLMMDPNPLPDTPKEMSIYLKHFWNTDLGKAEPLDYLHAYERWKGE